MSDRLQPRPAPYLPDFYIPRSNLRGWFYFQSESAPHTRVHEASLAFSMLRPCIHTHSENRNALGLLWATARVASGRASAAPGLHVEPPLGERQCCIGAQQHRCTCSSSPRGTPTLGVRFVTRAHSYRECCAGVNGLRLASSSDDVHGG